MGSNNIIYLIHTVTEMWAQREVTEGKDRQKAVERITENLRCLRHPVRGSFLWQARKYFSNPSPCWHRCVIDTNMPALLNPPLSSTFTTLLLSLNALGVMELIEGGESGRGGEKAKWKKYTSPELWGCPWLWKICTFLSPHLRLESTVSRKHGS